MLNITAFYKDREGVEFVMGCNWQNFLEPAILELEMSFWLLQYVRVEING